MIIVNIREKFCICFIIFSDIKNYFLIDIKMYTKCIQKLYLKTNFFLEFLS